MQKHVDSVHKRYTHIYIHACIVYRHTSAPAEPDMFMCNKIYTMNPEQASKKKGSKRVNEWKRVSEWVRARRAREGERRYGKRQWLPVFFLFSKSSRQRRRQQHLNILRSVLVFYVHLFSSDYGYAWRWWWAFFMPTTTTQSPPSP